MRSFQNVTKKAKICDNHLRVRQFRDMIRDWHLSPGFIKAMERAMQDSLPKARIHRDSVSDKEIRWMNRYGFSGSIKGYFVEVLI